MLSELQQKAVWEGWLSAEIRANYFAELCGRYQWWQRFVTWATLVISSSAAATLLSDWLPDALAWIRPTLAFVTAGLSIWALVGSYSRNATECSDLHFRWNKLAQDYEALWDDMYVADARNTLATLKTREAEITKASTPFPNDEARVRYSSSRQSLTWRF